MDGRFLTDDAWTKMPAQERQEIFANETSSQLLGHLAGSLTCTLIRSMPKMRQINSILNAESQKK